MLLTNRRHRLLFAALAGLEISWYLPFLALLLAYWAPRTAHPGFDRLAWFTTQPLLALGLCWLAMLGYMLVLDLLNRRQIEAPLRQLAVLVAFALTSGLAVMLLVYPAAAWLTQRWLLGIVLALYNFTAGIRPELLVLLLNFFLWFRVATFADRDLSFFSVGLTFRVALLLAILANGLLTTLGNLPPGRVLQYFGATIILGLVAAALARIDDKAQGVRHSSGALMPWSRLLQILALVGVVVGVALAASMLIAPEVMRTVLGWTAPLWELLGALLGRVIIAILIGLTPFFDWLAALIQARLQELPPTPAMEPLPADEEIVTLSEFVERAALLRYCLVTGAIVVALGLLWLFVVRTQRRARADEEESTAAETTHGEGGLELGLGRLRTWLNLLRRYGVSSRLLDAVSVENIYANVVRMAARRGVTRAPAQAPDRFLPDLQRAFPGHDAPLERITLAYMRVYYGGRALSAQELRQLRADYRALNHPPNAAVTDPETSA